jgi:hypothetical protein
MKFTIRDMLFVTVIVALLFGWLVDHGQLTVQIERCRQSGLVLSQQLIEVRSMLEECEQRTARQLRP